MNSDEQQASDPPGGVPGICRSRPDAGGNKVIPTLHVKYEVVAYDEGGYGDNRSCDFASGAEAVAYARSLAPRFNPAVIKTITMDPIRVYLEWRATEIEEASGDQ